MIKRKVESNKLDKERKFEFTLPSAQVFANTSKRSRQLLIDIICKVGSGCDIESLVVTGQYNDFGYDYKQMFYRDRKELVTRGFLVMDGQEMFVNPAMINYLTRRQMDWLMDYFKLRGKNSLYGKGMPGTHRFKNIPPPPPPVPVLECTE